MRIECSFYVIFEDIFIFNFFYFETKIFQFIEDLLYILNSPKRLFISKVYVKF